MKTMDFIDQVLFVIVLYKKRAEESESVQLLTHGLLRPANIFVYDNSPNACSHFPTVMYVHDAANSGVSKAYNEAHKIAKSLGKTWMMLLDQDTVIDHSFLDALADTVGNHPDSVLFAPMLHDRRGMVSPFRWTGTGGIRTSRIGTTLDLKYFRFQNSGLLVSTRSFEDAGGYDENIALDFSDIAFGERMVAVTNHFVVVNYQLTHAFSETERVGTNYALSRYVKFCEGAFAMGKTFGKQWQFNVRAFMRGVKLSFRHKDIAFIKIFFTA